MAARFHSVEHIFETIKETRSLEIRFRKTTTNFSVEIKSL